VPVDEAVLEQLLAGITVLRDEVMFLLYLTTGLRLVELSHPPALPTRRDETGIDRVVEGCGVIGREVVYSWCE
jgi:hypothetical protein